MLLVINIKKYIKKKLKIFLFILLFSNLILKKLCFELNEEEKKIVYIEKRPRRKKIPTLIHTYIDLERTKIAKEISFFSLSFLLPPLLFFSSKFNLVYIFFLLQYNRTRTNVFF